MGTVTVRYIADPFHVTGVETRALEFAGNVRVRDAVGQAFPDLPKDGLIFVRHGAEVDANAACVDGDTVLVAVRPAGTEAFWIAVLKIVITALVSAAVSYLIGYLMRPKQKNKGASPAYSVNIEQNAARLAGTIPVIYGRVVALPDIASQPYSEYLANNERVSLILCLGMGEYAINDIVIGETRASDYPAGSIRTWIFGPQAHKQTLGVIESLTGVCEDMFTVPESTGVDLAAPNDPTELSVAGSVSGGVLTPNDPTSAEFWLGLNPGQKYTVTGGGVSVIVKFIGIGPDNSAQFDGPLPPAHTITTVNVVGTLTPANDATEGEVMKLTLNAPVPAGITGGIITATAAGVARGPYKVYRITGSADRPPYGDGGPLPLVDSRVVNETQPTVPVGSSGDGGGVAGAMTVGLGPPAAWLRKSGPGYASTNNTPINPSATITVRSDVLTVYYVVPYYDNITPPPTDPYRWRGWFALCRPGQKVTDFYLDISMPSGLVWITDKGDYHVRDITWIVQYQQIDDAGKPVGAIYQFEWQKLAATTTPQRETWHQHLLTGPARFRVRIARKNNRDQRASKEISKSDLSGIRARLYHAPDTPAYEFCTLLVMQFTASAGLSAAASRRVKVDCTRRLPALTNGALLGTSNPCEMFVDILENTEYGAARPRAETDTATLNRLRPQWSKVNGFNGVFDQPITTVEALQAVLGPVNAVPLPVGSYMSVAQDAPRTRDYIFDPGTIVADTLTIGYNFDGNDEPDHLEIIYADPRTMADVRVYYPAKGLRPDVVEVFGCTSAAQALAWGKLRWQEKIYNRKTCQFELEGEGYLIQPLTRFGIALPNVDWGSGGVVLYYNPTTRAITLDQPYPPGVSVIYLKDDNTGKILPPVSVATRVDDYHLILATAPNPAPHPATPSQDATRWTATGDDKLFFEFSVTNLEATGPMRVRVTGTQYTTQKFVGTFVEFWKT